MALATCEDLVFSHSHKRHKNTTVFGSTVANSSMLRALNPLTESHGFDISYRELNFFLSHA